MQRVRILHNCRDGKRSQRAAERSAGHPAPRAEPTRSAHHHLRQWKEKAAERKGSERSNECSEKAAKGRMSAVVKRQLSEGKGSGRSPLIQPDRRCRESPPPAGRPRRWRSSHLTDRTERRCLSHGGGGNTRQRHYLSHGGSANTRQRQCRTDAHSRPADANTDAHSRRDDRCRPGRSVKRPRKAAGCHRKAVECSERSRKNSAEQV